MILADTSVWIEFLRGKEPFASALEQLLNGAQVCTIEPIFGELLQGCRNQTETTRVLKYWQDLPRLVLPDLLIAAGKYSSAHKLASKGLALTDSAILVASEHHNCAVWTLDRALLQNLPATLRYKFSP